MSEGDLLNRSAGPAGFADGKDPEALRTIGEVAKALSIRPHVLRYWEEQFPMLKPLKRSGGRRYYRPEDIRLIEAIDRLVHKEGFTLKGARKALQAGSRSVASPAPVAPPIAVPAPPAGLSTGASLALRARLISLRSTLANALHEA